MGRTELNTHTKCPLSRHAVFTHKMSLKPETGKAPSEEGADPDKLRCRPGIVYNTDESVRYISGPKKGKQISGNQKFIDAQRGLREHMYALGYPVELDVSERHNESLNLDRYVEQQDRERDLANREDEVERKHSSVQRDVDAAAKDRKQAAEELERAQQAREEAQRVQENAEQQAREVAERVLKEAREKAEQDALSLIHI